MIEIDGSFGSGGGQILRTATGLSILTGEPIKVFNIRMGRPKPGLMPQHLTGLKAAAEICNAKLKGSRIGSKEIEFYPEKIKEGSYNFNIGTAGSIGLMLQNLSLASVNIKKNIEFNIIGGTDVKWSPPFDYLMNVTLPVLEKMGYKAKFNLVKRGFFPRGGGLIKAKFCPITKFKPLNLEKTGKIERIRGISLASKHLEKANVAKRQAKTAIKILKDYKPVIDIKYVDAACSGSSIVLWAKTSTGCILGSDSLGERGKPAEIVGKEAAESLLKTINSNSTVDQYLSDQILTYLALVKGKSTIIAPKLTSHAKTNIGVIKKFLDVEFNIKEQEGNVKIECNGLKQSLF